MVKICFYVFCALFMISCSFQKKSQELDFTQLIPAKPDKRFFQMEGYCVWCNGAVKGEDGKYHLFFPVGPNQEGLTLG